MLAGPPQAKRVLPTSQPAHELAMGRYAMARDARHKLPRRTKDDNASRIRAWRQAPSSGSAVSLIQQASVLASLTLTWRSGIASEYLSIRTIRTASSGSFETMRKGCSSGRVLYCERNCERPFLLALRKAPFRPVSCVMLTRPVTTDRCVSLWSASADGRVRSFRFLPR